MVNKVVDAVTGKENIVTTFTEQIGRELDGVDNAIETEKSRVVKSLQICYKSCFLFFCGFVMLVIGSYLTLRSMMQDAQVAEQIAKLVSVAAMLAEEAFQPKEKVLAVFDNVVNDTISE